MTPSTSASRRHVGRAVAATVLAALATGACDGDEPDGGTIVSDDGAELDDLDETLSSLGGATVDDVDIVHEDGSSVVRVGGLDIDVAAFAEYLDIGSDRHILIPPAWPTLNQRSEFHDAEPQLPRIAWAVLSQTELVTADESRARLDAQLWSLAGASDEQVVHASTVGGDAATCRTELRATPNTNRGPTLHGVVYFSGPGLASSAMLTLSGDGDDERGFVGDVVEAACGERPPEL